jgi:osmotically-inducible protein OsmY
MTNRRLKQSVIDELAWDPKVDSRQIAVFVDGGAVTLRGTVGSFRQKREARRAAERVHGVTDVSNDLEVLLLTDNRRADAELRGDVLRALELDAEVPSTVDAYVDNGVVTLSGTVDRQHQREEAEFVAGNVRGITGLYNDIYLNTPSPYAGDVRASIAKALDRDARIDADNIDVRTSNGTAILTGSVRSWAEHDTAVAAAWAAPGITKVDDRLEVVY